MASGNHISNDELNLVVNAKFAQAQQEIHKFEKDIKKLEDRNRSLQRQMDSLENSGKKDSKLWKEKRAEYGKNVSQVNHLRRSISDLTKSLDLNALTMSQLRKQAKSLQNELDNTSRAIHPEEYAKLQSQLTAVKGRMAELKETAKGFKESMLDDQTFSFLKGTLFVKLAEVAGKAFGVIIGKISEAITASLELAESADGVQHAFAQIDHNDELLSNLRKATKGTVNDFELMKAAMKAKDFRIPLEDLDKLLSFAQLKAQQTGQSVDYMVDSIVTGLGRKSKMILDNLGISAAEIDEKIQETGDFAKAVAQIVNTQLKDAGETYISAADRAVRRTVDLENAQLELGKALLPYKEWAEEAYGATIIRITDVIKWSLKHIDVLKIAAVTIGTLTAAAVMNRAALLNHTVSVKVSTTALKAWVTTQKEVQLLASPFTASWNGLSLVWYRYTGNVTKARIALVAFSKAMRLVPYMALAAGITAAAYGIYKLATRTREASPLMKEVDASMDRMAKHSNQLKSQMVRDAEDIKTSAKKSYTEQTTKIKLLTKTIDDNTKSVSKRREALDEIKKIIPAYHAQLTNEGKLINNNTSAIKEYTKNLYKAAVAQAALGKINKYADQMLDRQQWLTGRQENQKWVKQQAESAGYDVENRELGAGEGIGARYWMKDRGTKDGNLRYISEEEYNRLKRWNDLWTYNVQKISEHTEVMEGYNKAIDNVYKAAEKQGADLNKALGSNTETPNSSTPTKSTGTSKQDTAATDALKRQRQQELQIEQKNYEQIQRLWKEQLAKKAITQQEYDGIMLSLSMEHADCVLDIERQYAKESQKLTISDAQKKKELEQEQQRNVEKAENDAADARLKAFEQYQQQMEQLRQKGMSEADREKADRDAQLKVLEAYYKTALDYAKQDVEERLKVEEAYRKALKKLKDEWDKKDEEKKFRTRSQLGLTTETEELARAKAAIAANTDLSASDRAAAEENLEREHQQRLLRIRQEYGIARRQEVYDMELEQLRAAKDQELLTEEEYAKAEFQLRMDQWKEQFDYYSKLFGDAFNALQDAELETVRAKYDAEIDAARKAGKDTSALEEKKANEELKIQKKYADVNFATKLSQIVADTAVSIMKAYAELGPIAGSIAAALMGVTGAAQVAVAKAERDKIKRMTLSGSSSGGSAARVAIGRESGGHIDVDRAQDGRRFHAKYDPSRRGYVDRPTVIVGEGPMGRSKEWVASNAAVENPTIRPVIDTIDQAQRAGNVRTLDLQKVLLQQGRQQGGYLSPVAPAPPGTASASSAAGLSPRLLQRLTDVLERMETDGIPAWLGLDQIDAQNELRNRARSIAAK